MLKLQTYTPVKILLILMAFSACTSGIILIYQCTPSTQHTVRISPARQKAIQDSRYQAYIFEIDKNWSTAFEHYKNKNYRSSIKPFWTVIQLDTIDRWKGKYSYLSDAYVKRKLWLCDQEKQKF